MHSEQPLDSTTPHVLAIPALALDDLIYSMSPSPAPQLPLQDTVSDPTLQPPSSNGLSQPLPQQVQLAPSRPRSASPDSESLPRTEIDHMRARALHVSDPPNPNSSPVDSTPTEKELAGMVLRLTAHLVTYPDPAQLTAQAETIATLTAQRTFLVQQRDEEHERWCAERDSWDRVAEALLSKGRSTGQKDYEAERKLGRLQDDNSMLRHKLTDALDRVHALEAELSRLRPLLLVQPELLNDPAQSPGFFQLLPMKEEKESEKDLKKARRKPKREKEPVELVPEISVATLDDAVENDVRDKDVPMAEQDAPTDQASEDAEGEADPDVQMSSESTLVPPVAPTSLLHGTQSSVPTATPSTPPPAHKSATTAQGLGQGTSSILDTPATPRASPHPPVASSSYQRDTMERVDGSPSKFPDDKARGRRVRLRTSILEQERLAPPLLSDARTECLLVAARKIGKARAAVLAGIVRDREKERTREEKAREQDHERERQQRAAHAANVHAGSVQQRPIGADWDLRWFQDRSNTLDYRGAYPTTLRTPPTRAATSASVPGSRRGTPTPRPQMPSHLHPTMQHYSHGAIHPQNAARPSHQPGHAGSYPQHAVPLVYMQPPLAVPIPHVHPQGHVPLSMPVSVASGSGPVLVPIRPGAPWSMPTTPSRRDGANAAAAGASPGSSAATATPLDSLVSAARSMMNGAAPEEAGDVAGDGRRRSLRTSTRSGRKGGQGTDRDASPVPKKRKVGANTGAVSPTRNASEAGMSKKRGQRRTATRAQEKTAPDRKGKGRSVEEQEEPEQPLVSSTSITQRGTAPIGSTRVPSALDVLAEQAAQEIRPPVGAATHERRHSTSPARTERSNSQTTELDAVAELGHPASQSFLQAAGPSAQTLYTTLPNSIASTRAQSERLDAAATSNKRSIHSAPPLSIEVIPVSKKPSELGSSERQRTMG